MSCMIKKEYFVASNFLRRPLKMKFSTVSSVNNKDKITCKMDAVICPGNVKIPPFPSLTLFQGSVVMLVECYL